MHRDGREVFYLFVTVLAELLDVGVGPGAPARNRNNTRYRQNRVGSRYLATNTSKGVCGDQDTDFQEAQTHVRSIRAIKTSVFGG